MSSLGTKPKDGTNGKMVSALNKEISTLKARMYQLEQRIKALGG